MNSGPWYEVWAVPWINQSPGGTKPCPHSSVVWQVYYSGVWWCRQVWKLEVFSDILESFFFSFWFGQHWRYDREQQICSAHSEKRVSCSDYKIKHQMNCVSQACVEKRQGAKPTAYNDVLSFWQQLDRKFDAVLKQRPDEALNSHHVLFGVWISFTGLWKRLWNIKKKKKLVAINILSKDQTTGWYWKLHDFTWG